MSFWICLFNFENMFSLLTKLAFYDDDYETIEDDSSLINSSKVYGPFFLSYFQFALFYYSYLFFSYSCIIYSILS